MASCRQAGHAGLAHRPKNQTIDRKNRSCRNCCGSAFIRFFGSIAFQTMLPSTKLSTSAKRKRLYFPGWLYQRRPARLSARIRRHQKTLADLKNNPPALGYSHPEWLVKRWEKRWGSDKTLSLLEWNNPPPKTFARINLLKADPAKLLAQWREENVEYDFVRCDWLPENLVFELKSHPPLTQLASFQQGLFYIQDPSTLLAVHALDPKPGESILDLCAAPGGKLTYIAQQVSNEARIIAHDVSPDRLKLIEENCARLGVTCVQLASSERGVYAASTPKHPAGSEPTPAPPNIEPRSGVNIDSSFVSPLIASCSTPPALTPAFSDAALTCAGASLRRKSPGSVRCNWICSFDLRPPNPAAPSSTAPVASNQKRTKTSLRNSSKPTHP